MQTFDVTERSFPAPDGAKLFYRVWQSDREADSAVIVFHSGHEHSGRMDSLVEALGLDGVTYFGADMRGHGRSPGARMYVDSFQEYIDDAYAFVQHIGRVHGFGPSQLALIGHSEGAVVAASTVLRHQLPVRGLVLASPALEIRLHTPFGLPLIRLLAKVRPRGHISSFVMNWMLTHDREQQLLRRADPLIERPIGTKALIGLFDEGQYLEEHAAKIDVPTLMLCSGQDWVVRVAAERAFFAGLSGEKELVEYPGFRHHLFFERERHMPIAKTREFVAARLRAGVQA